MQELNGKQNAITVVREPRQPLGKRCPLNPDGTASKQSSVNVSLGMAVSWNLHRVPDSPHLAPLEENDWASLLETAEECLRRE
jgi:hypothetical protein